jgi:hypothetical protein
MLILCISVMEAYKMSKNFFDENNIDKPIMIAIPIDMGSYLLCRRKSKNSKIEYCEYINSIYYEGNEDKLQKFEEGYKLISYKTK